MKKEYLLSFDDTDNLETLGTGHLLDDFLHSLPADCEYSFISRHQLFVNPAVPYTSHNSSMCAVVKGELSMEELVRLGSAYLEENSAPGSDPGLCVADMDELPSMEELVLWGYRAKREVLSKAAAYELAERNHVHLSEHGGTGQGVVGALAAVGLRLAGQDGRVKGKKNVSKDVMTVQELLDETGFERVCAYGEGELAKEEKIRIDGKPVKAVYQGFCSTVIATKKNGEYALLSKDMVKCF
ncbi:MAG: hypothetical protein PUB88_06145 [Clostridium sp.]|nr:hypothetical protein [Clostridium sp.]